MPHARHLHVRVQHVTVRETHEQVFARRVDRSDLGSRLRSASAARVASDLELHELLADERTAQLGRGAKDRVTFGHATIVPDRPAGEHYWSVNELHRAIGAPLRPGIQPWGLVAT